MGFGTLARARAVMFSAIHSPLCAALHQVENKNIKVCSKEAKECEGLRYTFFRCKHGQIDPRTRIKGNKGY